MQQNAAVYEPPVLVELGKFAELTQGGPGSIIEDSVTLYI